MNLHDSMCTERLKTEGRNRGYEENYRQGSMHVSTMCSKDFLLSRAPPQHHEHTEFHHERKKWNYINTHKCEPSLQLLRLAVFSGTAKSKSGRV